MAVELNHTIIWRARQQGLGAVPCRDPRPARAQRTGVRSRWSRPQTARTSTIWIADGEIASQHYAFLVSEPEFDAIFGRIKAACSSAYRADPGQPKQGEINRHDGGRGLYFEDPNGHLLEIITRALRQRRLGSVRTLTSP